MAGSPDTHPGEEWDDVQAELASASREACSFSFDLSGNDIRSTRAVLEAAGRHALPWEPRQPRRRAR